MQGQNQNQLPKEKLLPDSLSYQTILNNAAWYGDGPPILPDNFSVKNTEIRCKTVNKMLHQYAITSASYLHRAAFSKLATKLENCQQERCGSMGCLRCHRALQRAKSAAHAQFVSEVAEAKVDKGLVLVTIIPLSFRFQVGTLHRFDITSFNQKLLNSLTSIQHSNVWFGSIDFDLERTSSNEKVWQPHWHLCTWTADDKQLRKQLKMEFPPSERYDYPIDVKKTHSLGFIPYINKTLKIAELLRHGRIHLPELLLFLDQMSPFDLMPITGCTISVQNGGFRFSLEAK